MRRILFSIAIFLFSLSSVMGQMIPITLPADGNWPTVVGDSIMIIGPRQNELTEEQRYFNPVYLMTYPGKEHLKAQMIRAGACDCDPTIPNRRIGVFSVAPDKKVSFSQGNLQYLPAIRLWKFANTQYEYLGNANKYLKPTFRNWVDLFGWSANNTTAPFGVSTSTNVADYAGDFVDWGTNTICGDAPGTWRTLSVDEWEYLLNGRENAAKLMGHAQINEINGFIFLPDDWHCPNDITFQPGVQQYADQTFTIDQWTRLEQAGAVFLPAAGRRGGTELLNLNEYGNYWSATLLKSDFASYFAFNNAIAYIDDLRETYFGRPVRLVHDTIVPETIPEPCIVVKVNDTLSINMMCVEGGTFQMGATPEMDPDALAHEAPVHSVTLSDYYIGQIEVTQALWKTVMGTNPSTIKDNNRPVNNVSWEDCQVFIEKLNQKTGYSFRLPTEAEWEYAARGGNKSRGYKYAGSDNIDEVAWYKDNSGGKYQPFALKKPNELGIYDMSGNVFEWCQDWYGPYSADAQVNPQGPESGPYHMIRGGGWKHIQSNRVTYRRTTGANLDITSIGLRLVLDDTALTPPEPEYVDLGLSVKWATFNMGATSPNEIGNFYAWGEIEPKDTYTVNNYKWWNKTSKEITKYCTIDSLAYGGAADGLTELQPQDDIAHTLKGEHWRMPDLDECKELGNGCTWTVSTRQGQIGFEGISKINGNTIFLPVVGFRAGANLVHETLGGYWSSTLNIEKQSCAMGLYLNRETPSVGIYYNSSRQNGFLIRPVYDEVPDPCLVVKVNDTLSINLMCVEGGTFMMGSDAPDAQADEQPVHEVTLSDYYIGQTEVTQHLWKAVMGSGNNPSATKGNNLPVTDITWDETQQFVERLSELTGLRFRLPTEAEWEYAARGGQKSKGYTYAGSNDIDQVGWYNGNSSNKTHAVGQKQPNELGIYDMTGNVWEYCYDWHTPYAAQAQTNPTGAATGDKHVLRGGCYHYDPKNCTNTNRHSYYTPDKGGASTGLRIVLEP